MTWIQESKKVENLEVEVCFLLAENYFVGDPNNVDHFDDEKYRETLELPSFPRVVESMARTREIIDNVDALSSYYKSIIERSVSLKKSFNDIRQYFWLRLWFWNSEEGVLVSFPWYDSLSEMQQFFSWLKGDAEKTFCDMDQGWEVNAVHSDEYVYIRQTDPDSDEVVSNVAVPLVGFAEEAAEVESRAIKIIADLSNEIGVDVWTKYLQDASFGTKDWQPG